MNPVSVIEARIARRVEVAQGICALDIVPHLGAVLPAYDAGAHIDVHVGGFVRQYSLLEAPEAEPQRYRIAVLRTADSRGGSVAVHQSLLEGARLQISAPRNQFPLQPAPARAVLVGGGIGITPLLSMAGALHARGVPFVLHYCGRDAASMAFRQELLDATYAGAVQMHLDGPGGKPTFDCRAALATEPDVAHLYVCGPHGFMVHVLETARAAGWAEGRLHSESFQPVAASPDHGDRPFELIAVRSGQRIAVAADETVLQALARCGVAVPSSCEQGVCGTCLLSVLEGAVEHRDTYLTDEEKRANDQFLPCCSRARGASLSVDI
jgi:vanillate O-demethylase ferredoxin subunit